MTLTKEKRSLQAYTIGDGTLTEKLESKYKKTTNDHLRSFWHKHHTMIGVPHMPTDHSATAVFSWTVFDLSPVRLHDGSTSLCQVM